MISPVMNYKFEDLAMYSICFYTYTNEVAQKKCAGTYIKPMKVRIIAYYVGETDECFNFAMGVAQNDQDFNKISIPKCTIAEEPLRLDFLKQKTS